MLQRVLAYMLTSYTKVTHTPTKTLSLLLFYLQDKNITMQHTLNFLMNKQHSQLVCLHLHEGRD
jgi:hypothetical protein